MADKLAILAGSGSLQARSSNAALVRAAQRVVPAGLRLTVPPSLADVPLLNAELDPEGGEAPATVPAMLTVPAIKTKLDDHGEVADAAVLRRIRETLVALGEAAAERRAWLG